MLYEVITVRGVLFPPGTTTMSLGWTQFLRPSLINSLGFLLTGVLSGILGEDIRRARDRTQDRENVLQSLETLHKHVLENISYNFV